VVLDALKEKKTLMEGRERRENERPSPHQRKQRLTKALTCLTGVPLAERVSRGAPSFTDSYVYSFTGTNTHASSWKRYGGSESEKVGSWACH